MEGPKFYEPKPNFEIPSAESSIQLERIKGEKDQDTILRSINILKGSRTVREHEPDYKNISHEIGVTNRLIGSTVEAVQSYIASEKGGYRSTKINQIVRFQKKLIQLFIGYKGGNVDQLLKEISDRVQKEYIAKYPGEAQDYKKYVKLTEGIQSVVQCVQELSREKMREGKTREFFINDHLDHVFAIDLVECVYNNKADSIDIDELSLIQVKNHAPSAEESAGIQYKHFQFTESVLTKLQAFDMRYNPDKVLAHNLSEEELKELTSSVHEAFLMQLIDYYGNEDKVTKQQLAAELINKLGSGAMSKYDAVLKSLKHGDKINYVMKIIGTFEQHADDPEIVSDLKEIKAVFEKDLNEQVPSNTKRAAKIKTINSVVWSKDKGKQEVKTLFGSTGINTPEEQPVLAY